MKFHDLRQGTNPRRVTIYLAEKGIDLDRHEVDAAAGEHKSPAYLALNPAGRVPVLELDDGRAIAESAAIVEYLEELHPEPPMIGTDPVERAQVRALERIANDLIIRAHLWLAHSIDYFAGRIDQKPVVAEAARPFVEEQLRTLEAMIGDKPFLAGDRPTIADCTLFALFQSCRVRFGMPFAADYPRLDAWYARFAERPSAAY